MGVTASASPSPSASSSASSAQAQKNQLIDQLMSALGGSAASGTGRVFMGYIGGTRQVSPFAPTGATGQAGTAGKASWLTETEAENNYQTWNSKKQQDFLSKLVIGGLVNYGAGTMEASAAWRKLVKEAARYGSQGVAISPFDILSSYVNAAGGTQKGQWQTTSDGKFKVNVLTGEKRYIGPQFQTTTAQSTDMTDPATAQAIAIKVFQDMMGRNPGKGEIAAFASALSQAEASSPTVATTTTQYDTTTGEAVGTKSTTTGGVSADAKVLLAQEQAKKSKDYGAIQASTTYENALENAVWGAPG